MILESLVDFLHCTQLSQLSDAFETFLHKCIPTCTKPETSRAGCVCLKLILVPCCVFPSSSVFLGVRNCALVGRFREFEGFWLKLRLLCVQVKGERVQMGFNFKGFFSIVTFGVQYSNSGQDFGISGPSVLFPPAQRRLQRRCASSLHACTSTMKV